MMDDSDRAIYGEATFRREHALLANHFDEGAGLRAEGDLDIGQHAEAELQGKGGTLFQFALRWRFGLQAMRGGGDGKDLWLEKKAQRVDGMNAAVSDGAAARHASVVNPRA